MLPLFTVCSWNSYITFFIFSAQNNILKSVTNKLSDNKNYWDSLSEKSKSSWFWGSPGEKINPKVQSTHERLSNLPKSENFVVLNFEIYSVDLLKLEQPVHKRYLWKKVKNIQVMEFISSCEQCIYHMAYMSDMNR